MTDEEFRVLLDRHGGDLNAWPPSLAEAAVRLLAGSLTAQAMLNEMTLIELALAEDDGTVPPPDLSERIFERAFGGDFTDRDNGKASRGQNRRLHH